MHDSNVQSYSYTCMHNYSYRVETRNDTLEDDDCLTTSIVLPTTAAISSSISVGTTSECSTSQTSLLGSVRCSSSPMPLVASGENIDLGALVQAAGGSWDKLRALVSELSADRKKQYLSFHSKPASAESLHSHPVTKLGRTWNVSFQLRWMEKYPWLSYSILLSGGICRYCILFPEQPGRGDGLGRGNRAGVFILSPYKGPYSKALGKDGVLVCHDSSVMHCRAAERADLFLRSYNNPSERIMKARVQQANENKHILRQIILAVEFLAKQVQGTSR